MRNETMPYASRFLIPLTLVLTGAAHSEAPTLDEIAGVMDTAWEDVQSMSADVTMDFDFPVGNESLALTGSGTFNYLRDGGKDKSRQQITTKIPEPFAMEMKVDILFDGEKMHTTMEMMGQKQSQVGEPSLEQGALPPGGSRLMESLRRHLELTALPNETLEGHQVFVLEGIPKDTTAPIQKMRFYIDTQLAVQRKTEVYHPDGTVGLTVLFTNLKQNTNPDPSLFVPSK